MASWQKGKPTREGWYVMVGHYQERGYQDSGWIDLVYRGEGKRARFISATCDDPPWMSPHVNKASIRWHPVPGRTRKAGSPT